MRGFSQEVVWECRVTSAGQVRAAWRFPMSADLPFLVPASRRAAAPWSLTHGLWRGGHVNGRYDKTARCLCLSPKHLGPEGSQ